MSEHLTELEAARRMAGHAGSDDAGRQSACESAGR